ncbi:lipoprotein N-acyltransferase Lnb domain-containing protein [Gaopeijia maritima]|uniref:DUF4105 domain-containing protein n=1 Tax=Gaopeijia maritima TaxID=3119007 RepID=A0ABU9EBQ1_9BACT
MEVVAQGAVEDPLTVYLVTMGPGSEVWNRFGHNAIWIHDERTGEDLVWNWGLFAFDQVGFIPRLIRGQMLYSMGGFTLEQTIRQYEREGRDVWAQELALTPQQKEDLDRFVRRNAQPANRDYFYDYYLDNCSTRVRDALDLVLDGAIERHFGEIQTGTTWRWHTRRLLRDAPWAYGGVALVLGQPGDDTITAWEEMFLPMRLRSHLAGLFVEQRDGSMRPLVAGEIQLVEGTRGAPPTEPVTTWPRYLLLGLGIGALVLLAGLAASRGAAGRAVAALPVALVGLVVGGAGVILLAAYLTDHTFWYRNENIFFVSPFSLLVALFALGAVARPRLVEGAARMARWVAVLALVGAALKLLPFFDQGNLEIVALALPVHLAVAVAVGRWRSAADRADAAA